MNGLAKDLLIEVAEMFPRLMHDRVPANAPNFPNDLEPVIRANKYDVPASTPAQKEDRTNVQVRRLAQFFAHAGGE